MNFATNTSIVAAVYFHPVKKSMVLYFGFFFFGMSYFPHVSLVDSPLIESLKRVDSHHGITVPHGLPMGFPWASHGLPMGFPWAHRLQAFILKGDSRSALRVTKESWDAQRHGI